VPSAPVLIRGATVLTGTGERLDDADVLLQDGRIVAIGRDLAAPAERDRRGRHAASGSRPASSTCTRTWACTRARA
jgi:dihydroorotase-like cyclic amidohydrolase